MKLALLQMYVRPGQVNWNLAHARECVLRAARMGAQMVLLPEALPFGWMEPARGLAEEIPSGAHFRELAAVARECRIYLCSGLVEKSGTRLFNAAVLLSPRGELLLHHRKIHELGIAHDCYALGDRLGVIETELGRIGLMICADGFAPGQALSRALSFMGAQLILSPCAWAVPSTHDNTVSPYGQLWLDNYGPVTREFGSWIAACSNVGPILNGPWAGHKCIGCSLVVGPGGVVHARGRYGEDAEEILIAELSLTAVQRLAAE